MSKANQNFSLYRGETRVVFIDLDAASGQPFDATGSLMRWCLARTPYAIDDGDEILIEKSLGDGLAVTTGGVNITLLSSDTYLDPNLYYHELRVFLPNGGESLSCTGTVHVRAALDLRPRVEIDVGNAVIDGTGTVT